jgi:mono/diheme cytochrome c family protein
MWRCFSINTCRRFALLAVTVFLQTGQAAENERSGEVVYQKVCQYCHETGIGPELRSRKLPAVYTLHVVRNGFRAMPAFRPTEISDQELERVASFIERNNGSGE